MPRLHASHFVLFLAILTLSCDKVPLTAPTGSSVTLSAATRTLSAGGTTEVTAFVLEGSGTPVQNGTHVTFTTTLGTIAPTTVQTTGGRASATFTAGTSSGVAEVRATSGAAGATSGAAAGATASNVLNISIGAAAIDTLTVRALQASVSSTGGSVDIVATATGTGGLTLVGIPVTFTTDNGTLSASVVNTNASGEARTTLTTDRASTVTAAAGSKSGTAAITVRTGPSVTFTCAVGSTANCAAVNVNQPVTFTVARGTTTTNIRSAVLDFGDNDRLELGTLTSTITVNHTYSSAGTLSAKVTATDTTGEQAVTTQIVQVRANVTVTVSASTDNLRLTATATASGGTATSYEFKFSGGSPAQAETTVTTTSNTAQFDFASASTGLRLIKVKVTFADGRTAEDSIQKAVP